MSDPHKPVDAGKPAPSSPTAAVVTTVLREGLPEYLKEGAIAYLIHKVGDEALQYMIGLFKDSAESRAEEAEKRPERKTRFSKAMVKLHTLDFTAWKIINHLQVALGKPRDQEDFQVRCAKGRTEEELVAYLISLAKGLDDTDERLAHIEAEGFVGKRAEDTIEKSVKFFKKMRKKSKKAFKEINEHLAGDKKSRKENKKAAKDARARFYHALKS